MKDNKSSSAEVHGRVEKLLEELDSGKSQVQYFGAAVATYNQRRNAISKGGNEENLYQTWKKYYESARGV